MRFLAKQLSPSMKSECVDRFQKRSLDRSLDRSLSFILFLRKKIEEEVNIVLDDTRFFRFLRFCLDLTDSYRWISKSNNSKEETKKSKK